MMSRLREFGRGLALCAAFVAVSAAQAQSQAPAAPAAASAVAPPVVGVPEAVPAATAEYVLGPEDVIEYDVVGTSDRVRARIYTDGTIQTNFGMRVGAAGRTPRELAAEISKTLRSGGYYADPVVNVEVVGYASRYVTVLGAVSTPGLVPINRPFRLSEILARVGGVRGDAADYLIVRPENGQEKRYNVEKLAAGDPSEDPPVTPGDKIFAPVAEIFYISGQIKAPGSYPLRTDMTIAQAIAKGGGVTESGSDKKVKVRRGSATLKLKGDAKVMPGDVLTVGERLF